MVDGSFREVKRRKEILGDTREFSIGEAERMMVVCIGLRRNPGDFSKVQGVEIISEYCG